MNLQAYSAVHPGCTHGRPPHRNPLLSGVNPAEVHVLAAITRDHDVPLQRVRRAVKYFDLPSLKVLRDDPMLSTMMVRPAVSR